ncbi:MAG: 2-amino-4-hydroxy-6-hydroxymethyldihydropteridine diphosphokinase [Candidatus Aminicenantia bacterium]
MLYFLSLGSNIGDKRKNLAKAISLLSKLKIKIKRSSSLYSTQPVDFLTQDWFYNQVIEIETNLDPFCLLQVIKEIEKNMGRERSIHKGPRIIDIDILLAEDIIIQSKELTIPHPRMHLRNFVLIPLAEISPLSFHPLRKERIGDLLAKSKDNSLVRRVE